jgi:hypothetical protein
MTKEKVGPMPLAGNPNPGTMALRRKDSKEEFSVRLVGPSVDPMDGCPAGPS